MRETSGALARVAVLAVVVGGVGACAPLSAGGVVLGGGGVSAGAGTVRASNMARAVYVTGEVRSVDVRRGRLQLRDARNRTRTVRFDRRTRVVHQRREYPVSALERGDVVRASVVRDRSGAGWVEWIEVRHNVRDRGRAVGRVARLDGAVVWVDSRRGSFTLERRRDERVVVHLPRRLSAGEIRRFERLRPGQRVRVEVRPLGRGQVELVRFR